MGALELGAEELHEWRHHEEEEEHENGGWQRRRIL
jgi:hypothetical protein